MTTLQRWLRFNLVGILGTLLQLAILAVLNHMMPGHYLITSTIALECTLLHNFAWHRSCTWKDRHAERKWRAELARFHLANGSISLASNLLLLPFLTQRLHSPLLLASSVAIVCGSCANFVVGHVWVFPRSGNNLQGMDFDIT